MRLSETLRRDIMKTAVGGIINRFKVNVGRRDTLFFEELIAKYIQECEKAGYSDETRKMGEEWGFLIATLAPEAARKISPLFLLNIVIRNVWHNLGLIDDMHMEKSGNTIHMSTKNEAITRYIGANNFMPGAYAGTAKLLFGFSANPLEIKQEKQECGYTFKLQGEVIQIEARSKEVYDRLNNIAPIKGFTLKDALKRKMFTLRDNRIYFRNKSIMPVENTLFHIIGKENIIPEKMAEISYDFFNEIIDKKASKDKKLLLFKTIFQIMGWGAIKILLKERGKILVEFRNPPHGLLPDDNWEYIARTTLGYLWLADKGLKIANILKTGTSVSVEFHTRHLP